MPSVARRADREAHRTHEPKTFWRAFAGRVAAPLASFGRHFRLILRRYLAVSPEVALKWRHLRVWFIFVSSLSDHQSVNGLTDVRRMEASMDVRLWLLLLLLLTSARLPSSSSFYCIVHQILVSAFILFPDTSGSRTSLTL